MIKKFDFSVLVPVYHKDDPIFFEQALTSIYCDQTVKPSEILILVDGPVGKKIEGVINDWKTRYPEIVNIVQLRENIGLGGALSIGLESCSYELVARMDSDDIARYDRFEKQLARFESDPNLIICGSNVSEFILNHQEVTGERKVPMGIKGIAKFAIYRNPINHPTVMFKRLNIIDAGGYRPMPCFEDYYLWVRCIMVGFSIHNIQENLVFMRGGESQLARRSGLDYVLYEWKFLRELKACGFLSFSKFVVVLFSRTVARVAPAFIFKKIYSRLRSDTVIPR